MVGIAVVGAGAWGLNHVRTFATLEGARLLWVCDQNSQALERAAKVAGPQTKTTNELSKVLADDDVKGVVIATDAPSHAALALKALQADKDIFVEKPVALSTQDALEVHKLAKAKQRIALVGHLLLYHPAVQALRQYISEGVLGDILYVYANRLNLGVVRKEENAWWSLAPHDISIANFLLDATPEAVSAQGGIFLQKQRGIEDVVFATLFYPQSRLAHVHVSWLDPHKTRRLTVVGTKKMAIFEDTSSDQKLILCDKGVEPPPHTLAYAEGVRVRTGDLIIPAIRMAEPLLLECRAFIDAIRTREAPLAGLDAGVSVVQVLEAGSRSLAEEGRRIKVAATT